MGVLGLIDAQDLLDFTTLKEVQDLDTEILERYIARAELMMTSMFSSYDSSLEFYSANMELAACLLTENLIISDTPAFRRSQVARMRSEQMGSYSYSKGENKKDSIHPAMTDEVLSILRRYKSDGLSENANSTTHVFAPRTVNYDGGKSGTKYYVPEDASAGEGAIQDPPDPRFPAG